MSISFSCIAWFQPLLEPSLDVTWPTFPECICSIRDCAYTWYLRKKSWRHGGTSGGNSRSRLFITSYTELLGCDVLGSYMSLSLTFHSRSIFFQRWIYPRFALWGPAEGKKLGDCQVVGASDVFFVRALCCRWFLHHWGNTVAVVYSKLSTDELWMEHLGQSFQWVHDPFSVSWTRSKSYLRLAALMRYGTTEICGQDTRWPVWERMFELQFRIVPRIFLDDLPSCLSKFGFVTSASVCTFGVEMAWIKVLLGFVYQRHQDKVES